MKFIAIIFSAMFAFSTSTAKATNSPSPSSYMDIFTSTMYDIDYEEYDLNADKVFIEFMVNNREELIILSTSEKSLDSTIKNMINYKKVDAEELVPFKKYIIKVVLKK